MQMQTKTTKDSTPSRYATLWQHPAVQQRLARMRWWIVRALEKLGNGG